MDGNTNSGNTELSSDSTFLPKSNVSDKTAIVNRSGTSIGIDGRDHNDLPIDEPSRAVPAEPMVAGASVEEKSIHRPKPLTVAGLRETLIQIMEDADLRYIGREKNIGDAMIRTAHSDLEDQASLVAYVEHLEKTVASLRDSLQSGAELSTPDSPVSASIHEKELSLQENDAGDLKVEVKRWRELCIDGEDVALELVDDALAYHDKTEKKRTTRTGYVLISYSVYNGDKFHTSTRLEINSTTLIQTLQKVIQKYPAFALETLRREEVVLSEPYMMIFHHYNQLHEEHNRLKGESKEHLGLLLDFVRDEWPKVSETISRITETGIKEIGFNELWLLYSPGTIIYTRTGDELRAYRVNRLGGFHRSLKVRGLFTTLSLECSWLRFNIQGNKLVKSYMVFTVSSYTGMQAIRDLEFVPAGYLPGEASQKELLIARGQRYWDYRDKGHFQSYFGTAWLTATPKDGHRVIIDYSTSSRTQDHHRRFIVGNARATSDASLQEDPRRNSEYISHDQTSEDENDSFTFSDTENCSAALPKEDAFKRLVIKGKHKTVVKAMVRAHLSKEPTSGDLIQGKGRGLIVLLHGSPGTGKTLTAECVAEKENRPLYMVTCGDLGTKPDDLERRLKQVFEYAVNWNAVLLLDEADVFLQERDVHDVKRNALVSVFLRELEYFDGVLFLTTNRPGSMDEAFQSRIHITIGLPELDAKSQLQVWTIFVKDLNIEKSQKVGILEFVDEDIKKNGNLNGRQIRNSVRTALAIAAQMDETISEKHIRDVLEIGRDFTKYLQDVNRMNQEQRAAALGHRAPVVN